MKATARNAHYTLGMFSLLFVLCSAVTGLLWAYAPYLYWQPGYLEKKTTYPAPSLLEAPAAWPTLADRALTSAGDKGEPDEIALRRDAGLLLIEVGFPGAQHPVLLDAVKGVVLSPLSRQVAERFARQYVAGNPEVKSAALLKPWIHRKGHIHEAAWVIRFGDRRETEIVIDAHTGVILEDSDVVRRLHFSVMDLHQFNFFGTRKVLSAVSGVPLLILGISGAIIGFKRLRGKNRNRKKAGVKAISA